MERLYKWFDLMQHHPHPENQQSRFLSIEKLGKIASTAIYLFFE
jgi:hypothetical protein